MSAYPIAGDDAQTVLRRRLMQSLSRREGYLATITDSGPLTAGPEMRRYLDQISSPDSHYRMLQAVEVAEALGVSWPQLAEAAKRLGLDGDRQALYSMADALRLRAELVREAV